MGECEAHHPAAGDLLPEIAPDRAQQRRLESEYGGLNPPHAQNSFVKPKVRILQPRA
jgi:hypothetical protein